MQGPPDFALTEVDRRYFDMISLEGRSTDKAWSSSSSNSSSSLFISIFCNLLLDIIWGLAGQTRVDSQLPSLISLYIYLFDRYQKQTRSKSKEQLNKRRAGLSKSESLLISIDSPLTCFCKLWGKKPFNVTFSFCFRSTDQKAKDMKGMKIPREGELR